MTALDAALEYVRMGLFVFPCNGKQPLVQWGTESTTNPETVRQWWSRWPSAGIGIDCGRSGLVVIDLDVKSNVDGPANWRQRLNGHPIPATFNVRTPSGGWHGWYRDPAGRYRNSAGQIAPGVDVRGVGGYVLAPGSPGYRWYGEIPLGLGDVPIMPEGIIPTAPTGTGHWSTLNRAELEPRDLAALKALEQLGGHGAYRADGYTAITRPGKIAGTSAAIGHIGPGLVKIFTPNWPPLKEGAVYDAEQLTRDDPQPSLIGEKRDLLADRLEWRRADQEAQRILAAEQRPPTHRPEVLTLRERLARPRPDIRWRIDTCQPADSRVMLAAQFKAGKTTLIANLVRSLVDAVPFLGTYEVTIRPETVAVVDFEMSPHQLDDWYADQKIENDDRVTVIPLRGAATTFDIINPDIRRQWADMLTARQCDYLIIDCLRPILDALGLDEHRDAGQFLTSLDMLLADAAIPDAVVVHHMGHTGERSRGDSRIRDWPDVEWRLVREDDDPSSPRYISMYGRDVEIAESLLDYDPASRRLTISGGSRRDAAARAALIDIVGLLTRTDGLSGNKIEESLMEDTEHGRKAIRAALRLGLGDGRLDTTPGARNAKLYFLGAI